MLRALLLAAAAAALACVCGAFGIQDSTYSYAIGAGIYDITGPVAEIGFMGYAMPGQRGHGLHYRLRARAFVIEANSTAKSLHPRVVFVSTDSCMIFTSVKAAVVKALQSKYGGLYNHENVLLSGIHTHAGPAGYAQYPLYDISSFGFVKENWLTVVNGIVAAIEMAHNNVRPNARILINKAPLLKTNANRSPYAYTFNPPEERAKYEYDVDKDFTVLRFEDNQGVEIGQLNWFAVHGTAMNNTNELVSGDNKGYASYLFEQEKNGPSSKVAPGKGPFVAAFGQSNEGDVTPNTRGAFCFHNFSWLCTYTESLCDGRSEPCQGYGPGTDGNDFDSNRIIGTQQFQHALNLYNTAKTPLSGFVDARHIFVDMENVEVSGNFTPDRQPGRTCVGALGDAFAGGTTDGPGAFDFHQGTNSTHTNPYWNFLGEFLKDPSPEQRKCQAPKPILLDTGGIDIPVKWTPGIMPLQIVRIGELFIIAVPGEFTTMSGRRLRDQVHSVVQAELAAAGEKIGELTMVIAGLSNAYSHYITTPEEYHAQRYEGGSTLYGINTLPAYLQEYSTLARALVRGDKLPPGPTPPDLSKHTFSFIPPVIMDGHPFGESFGSLKQDVSTNTPYKAGDTVIVEFWGANPRNDFQIQDTFLTVEQQVGANWKPVLYDGDPDTKFRWTFAEIDESIITISWDIAAGTPAGDYRIRTFGKAKEDPFSSKLTSYVGTSSVFTVA